MASLNVSLNFIPSKITPNEYKGISRVYFPKWEGWELLDNSKHIDESLVKDFYNKYFWARINGDLIEDQHMANLLFLFSVLSGKKKTLAKVRRILNFSDSVSDTEAIYKLNRVTNSDFTFLYLYAEIVEFLYSTNNIAYLSLLTKVYYKWLVR